MNKHLSKLTTAAFIVGAVIAPLLLSAFTTWAFSTFSQPEEGVVAIFAGPSVLADRDNADGCPSASPVVAHAEDDR
jgi:hypothetical protein